MLATALWINVCGCAFRCPEADSLNVATAAALAFYERTRSGRHVGPGTWFVSEPCPGRSGLAVAGFVAAVIAVAVVVLSLGLIRVHPLVGRLSQHCGGQRLASQGWRRPSAALVRAQRGSGPAGAWFFVALTLGTLATPAWKRTEQPHRPQYGGFCLVSFADRLCGRHRESVSCAGSGSRVEMGDRRQRP